MQKFCPQCQGVFDAQFICPTCGVMLMDGNNGGTAGGGYGGDVTTVPSLNIAQRLLAGLLLSQGGYFALVQASTAISHLSGMTDPFAPGPARFALQAATLLLGALIAGAGNPNFLMTGVAVGFVNALFLLGSQFVSGLRPPPITLLLTAGASTAVGIVGALVGSRYWPSLAMFTPEIRVKPAKAKNAEPAVSSPPVPIAWFRVIGGAALSIGCTVWAGPIRDFIVQNSHGALGVDSRTQLQFTAWIISALAMLIGGAFAGASTRGGLRHGFLVGLIAGVGVFVIHLKVVKEALPAQRFFSLVTGLPDPDVPSVGLTVLFLITNTLLIGTLGGWFGAKLLPRVTAPSGPLDRGAI